MAAAKKTVVVVAALLLLVALLAPAAPPASAANTVLDCKAGCDELKRLGVFNCEKRCEAIAAQAKKGPKGPNRSVMF